MSAETGTRPQNLLFGILLLLLGVSGVSTATLWIRLSDDSPSELAFRRMALAWPIVALWLWPARVRQPGFASSTAPPQRNLARALAVVAGLLLAAHFWSWTESLERLPAATSLILVSTHPVLVGLFEGFSLGFRGRMLTIAGAACAVFGAIALADGQDTVDTSRRTGLLLAFAGAVTLSGYLLVGRRLRGSLPTASYLSMVYGVAAVALGCVVSWEGGAWWPDNRREWGLALLLAIFPTLLGHTPMNAALRRLPASLVSTAFLGEVVIASLLVALFCGEALPDRLLWGGTWIVVGVLLAGWDLGRGRNG